MIHERDIRERLAAVVERRLSVGAFEQWLDAESWDMFVDSSRDAIDLVSAIQLLLYDYYEERIDEETFVSGLARLLNNIREVVRVPVAASYLVPLAELAFSSRMVSVTPPKLDLLPVLA